VDFYFSLNNKNKKTEIVKKQEASVYVLKKREWPNNQHLRAINIGKQKTKISLKSHTYTLRHIKKSVDRCKLNN